MAQLLVAQNLSFHHRVFTVEVLQGQGQQRPEEEVVAEQQQMGGRRRSMGSGNTR